MRRRKLHPLIPSPPPAAKLPEDDGLVLIGKQLVRPEVVRVAATRQMNPSKHGHLEARTRPSAAKRYSRCYPGPPDNTTPTFREFADLTGVYRLSR